MRPSCASLVLSASLGASYSPTRVPAVCPTTMRFIWGAQLTQLVCSTLLWRPREPPRSRNGYAGDGRQGQEGRVAVRHINHDRAYARCSASKLAVLWRLLTCYSVAQLRQSSVPRSRHRQVLSTGRVGARAGARKVRRQHSRKSNRPRFFALGDVHIQGSR